MNNPDNIAPLRGPVLREVSRSFYLSIRWLPGPMRDPVTLAYLLARASDTIADTGAIEPDARREGLAALAAVFAGNGSAAETQPLADRFAPPQGNPGERVLLEKLPAIVRWLERSEAADQRDIREVLGHITRGQRLDLERFPGGGVQALATAAELEEYTYLVAGCVGEFWTRIASRKLPRFADRSAAEMEEWGRAYGQGLQLVNVLRDLGADLRNGRCYLPADELAAVGVRPEEIMDRPEAALPVIMRWLDRAEEGLARGIDYACAVRPVRLRFATALPALIGVRTIQLMRQAGPDDDRPENQDGARRSAFADWRRHFSSRLARLPETPERAACRGLLLTDCSTNNAALRPSPGAAPRGARLRRSRDGARRAPRKENGRADQSARPATGPEPKGRR